MKSFCKKWGGILIKDSYWGKWGIWKEDYKRLRACTSLSLCKTLSDKSTSMNDTWREQRYILEKGWKGKREVQLSTFPYKGTG